MELEKLELKLELLQENYQNLVNEALPKDGDLSKINEVLKTQLLKIREELTLLRDQIFQLRIAQFGEEQNQEELDYLKALEEKFKDE